MNPLPRLKKLAMLGLVAAAVTLGLAATARADTPVNLRVDDATRAELLQAAAQLHQVPASEYVGLTPGQTYYAYDPDTMTYWAGASLMPSASSERAQVSVQDRGSYNLFKKVKGGSWTPFFDGAGGEEGHGCPQALPASILAMWQWDPQYCLPRR
jgi:hypothetical protein